MLQGYIRAIPQDDGLSIRGDGTIPQRHAPHLIPWNIKPHQLNGGDIAPRARMVEGPPRKAKPFEAKITEHRGAVCGDAVVIIVYRVNGKPGEGAVCRLYAAHIAAPLFCTLDLNAKQGFGKVAVPDFHVLHAPGRHGWAGR